MAARAYEFYLRVLTVSLTSERSERVRDTVSTRTIPLIGLSQKFTVDLEISFFLTSEMISRRLGSLM